MHTKSLWNGFAEITDYPELEEDIEVDVAIIGAGVTGVSTGNLLAQKGKRVVVLESRSVGGGTTSHSTGNLYCTIDQALASLQSKYDTDTIRAVAESRTQAMEQIASWVNEYQLDCDYIAVPWYLYGNTEESKDKIEQEIDIARDAGLEALEASGSEIPFPVVRAMKIQNQGQINPMLYVQQLARATQSERCKIYEHTPVLAAEEQKDRCVLTTTGGTVTADYVIHATHTPKGVMMVQSLLGPYREYGIACRTRGKNHPNGIYWGYYENEKKISTRNYERNGEHFLIVVGEPHKTGHAESNVKHIQELESFAQKYFDIQEVAFRWGGQHYRPADLLPYIGPRRQHSREYIATGYSTDGLTYGTLAGIILSDLITGKENPWTELYDATRKQPFKSASRFIKENIDVAKEYLKDLRGMEEDTDLNELKAGEGEVVEKDGEKLAVYRTDEGELEVRSAVCTHMGCVVNWNDAEKSWDCPCHGSRFKVDGSVLEGPAFLPLQKVLLAGDSVEVKDEH